MTRVYLADPLLAERSALRVLLLDLRMDLVGETSDWFTLYNQAGSACPDLILVSWDLLPKKAHQAIERLHKECPKSCIVAIVNQVTDYQSTIEASGADAIISKEDFPHRVAEILRMTVEEKDFVRR